MRVIKLFNLFNLHIFNLYTICDSCSETSGNSQLPVYLESRTTCIQNNTKCIPNEYKMIVVIWSLPLDKLAWLSYDVRYTVISLVNSSAILTIQKFIRERSLLRGP